MTKQDALRNITSYITEQCISKEWVSEGDNWNIGYAPSMGKFYVMKSEGIKSLDTLGYFKTYEDAQRLIDLMGDELLALFL